MNGCQKIKGPVLALWRISSSDTLLFSHSVVSDSSWPHGLQHARPPCPSLSPGVCSDSRPLSQWCHLSISSSVALLLLPSVFPSLRVFSNESALCFSGQDIGASASVLPVNIQDWFPLWLTGLVSLLSKGLSTVFSSTTVWKHQFFGAQWSISTSAWLTPAKSLYLCGLQNLHLSGDGCGWNTWFKMPSNSKSPWPYHQGCFSLH